jgi:hypothetical protein
VQNWPKFHIPLKELQALKDPLTAVINQYMDDQKWTQLENPTFKTIASQFYPKEMVAQNAAILEYVVMEEDNNTSSNNNGGNKEKRVALLTQYFLYGKVNPSQEEKSTDTLTGPMWNELCADMLNCNKALESGLTVVGKGLKDGTNTITQKLNSINGENEEENKKRVEQLQALLKSVTDVANEYTMTLSKTIQKNFFEVMYKLYADIITEYKNTKGEFQQQQPTKQQQAQQTTNTNAAQSDANANAAVNANADTNNAAE